jgi:hypothetical protein
MKTLGVDAPRVTPGEALELMAHHLQLAAMYYEATTKNHLWAHKEMERLMNRDMENSPCFVAARTWLNQIKYAYDEMADDPPAEKTD